MLELVYFPGPGRAEASRIALSLSGLEWQDIEVDGGRYETMKKNGELPWDMLPVLRTSEGTIAESSAILRFAGCQAGLIPQDPYQCAKADEFIDGMLPLFEALNSTFSISDLAERIQRRMELFEPQGECTKTLLLLERKIAQSETGWAAGTDQMSIADLKLFTDVFFLFSGNFDGIEPSIISNYPRLLEFHHKMSSDPRIQAHYANIDSEDIRWVFLPKAFENLSRV